MVDYSYYCPKRFVEDAGYQIVVWLSYSTGLDIMKACSSNGIYICPKSFTCVA